MFKQLVSKSVSAQSMKQLMAGATAQAVRPLSAAEQAQIAGGAVCNPKTGVCSQPKKR